MPTLESKILATRIRDQLLDQVKALAEKSPYSLNGITTALVCLAVSEPSILPEAIQSAKAMGFMPRYQRKKSRSP